MTTLVHQRVAMARSGTNPHVICRMPTGWAVLGDYQFFPGYTLLIPDPVVPDLNHLSFDQRTQFLVDMTRIGDALLTVTDAYRVNYAILGNTEAALHAHIHPRYLTEAADKRSGPVWLYDRKERRSIPFDSRRDKPLISLMRDYIESRVSG